MKYKKVDIPDKPLRVAHRGDPLFVVIEHEEGPKFRAGFAWCERAFVEGVRMREGLTGQLIGLGEILFSDTFAGIWEGKDGKPLKKFMLLHNGFMAAFWEYHMIANLDKYPAFRDAPRQMIEDLLRGYCRENGIELRLDLGYRYGETKDKNIFWPWSEKVKIGAGY